MKPPSEKAAFKRDPVADLGEDALTDEELFAFGALLLDAMTFNLPEGNASAAPTLPDDSDPSPRLN